MYKSQPLFGEVVDYLNKFNLEFIDFVGLRRWLPSAHTDIGQCVFGDALFLKSPELVSTNKYSQDEKTNYLKILLLFRRFDLIDKFIELSDEFSRDLYKEFLSALNPARKNFNRVNKLNNIFTVVLRFFGRDFKSHLLY